MESIIYSVVTAIVTGLITYFSTRKKYQEEVKSNLLDNRDKSLEFYIKLSDDNSRRLDKILEINESLEKEVAILKTQVTQLTEQLKKYQKTEKKS